MKIVDFYFFNLDLYLNKLCFSPRNWYSLSLLLIHGVGQIPVFAKDWEHC